MGFPNVDLLLRDIFLEEFEKVKADPAFAVNDLFDDRPESARVEITNYLISRQFTGNVMDRGEAKRVFILPHFPASDLPFPQIGIYSGAVDSTDRFLGDYAGESEPVYEGENIVAWDIVKGYWELSSWNIDVVASTKDEAVWLSRFCQYFICQRMLSMTVAGIVEVGISQSDLRIESSTLQPLTHFVRGVRVHARVANTWKKREPVGFYDTGVNLALPNLRDTGE